MEYWKLSRDILDTIHRVAHDWAQGVAIIKPFDGDFVILAVTKVDMYAPSSNIHHSTVSGKDISLAVSQKFSVPGAQGASPIVTYIDNITEERTWELTHNEVWYWVKTHELY
jgi:hypothetical protein